MLQFIIAHSGLQNFPHLPDRRCFITNPELNALAFLQQCTVNNKIK